MSNKESKQEKEVKRIEEGSEVTLHYIGKLEDGSEFDNSYLTEKPLTFKIGEVNIIPGFESAIMGREKSEKFEVTVPCSEAYGEYTEENVQTIPKDKIDLSDETPIGSKIEGTTPNGEKFICTLKSMDDKTVTLDVNHPLAGKDLEFQIEILDVA